MFMYIRRARSTKQFEQIDYSSLWRVFHKVLRNSRRYCSRITYQWDLTGFDTLEENSRPEYVAEMAVLRRRYAQKGHGVDTFQKPSYWRRKLPYTIFSISVILLAILLCVAAAIGVIIYR